jgi:hypothetical protein
MEQIEEKSKSPFIKRITKKESPSRTYVVVCNKTNFDGYFCKKFILPESEDNEIDHARWYFLNKIDFTSCIEMIMSFEDYSNISDSVHL